MCLSRRFGLKSFGCPFELSRTTMAMWPAWCPRFFLFVNCWRHDNGSFSHRRSAGSCILNHVDSAFDIVGLRAPVMPTGLWWLLWWWWWSWSSSSFPTSLCGVLVFDSVSRLLRRSSSSFSASVYSSSYSTSLLCSWSAPLAARRDCGVQLL